MPLKNAEICYLLAFPDRVHASNEPPEQIRGLKDAPYFQPVDISVRTLEQTNVEVRGVQISVTRQRYDDRIQMIEFRFRLDNVLSLAAIQQRAAIEKSLQEKFVPAEHRESGMFEEYYILLLGKAAPTPDKFIDRHAAALARFIRSQRETFDQPEIAEILSSRVRYSKDELTLVDWQAAVIIAPDNDFQSDIELMKIGNYQLMRYRRLDQNIENSLRDLNEQFRADPRRALRIGPTRGQIRRIVQHRLDLMLEFEHTEQNLLLIGDWYTSQLYHAIREEFYLNEWKETIKDKLDNLERIIETIQENFSLSWQSLLETIQITGWLILLIGYFILFFLESGVFQFR
jgi:predicted GIY-YIG superfamily endonuclease